MGLLKPIKYKFILGFIELTVRLNKEINKQKKPIIGFFGNCLAFYYLPAQEFASLDEKHLMESSLKASQGQLSKQRAETVSQSSRKYRERMLKPLRKCIIDSHEELVITSELLFVLMFQKDLKTSQKSALILLVLCLGFVLIR